MKKTFNTVRGHRLPPLHAFNLASLLDLSKRCGAQVEMHYHPRRREFLIYTKSTSAQTKLREVLQAFPEQTIRI